jgi:hypothetical protein
MTMTVDAAAAQQAYYQQAYTQPNGYAPPARRRQQGLSLLVQAHQKVGKSSLGDTGPAPRLILDVETASFWTPSRKIYWDPKRETCPVWPQDPRAESSDGYWDTCIVIIHDAADLHTLHQTLMTGQHPFNSISMDSVTEIQNRVAFALAGYRKLERDHWGVMLRQVNKLIHDYRDLLTHPVNQIWAITYICGTHFDQRVGKWRPLLQGAMQDHAPYVPDASGWLSAEPDGSRHLWIGQSPHHETGNRLWGRLPDDMVIGYPGKVPGWTVESMVSQLLAS